MSRIPHETQQESIGEEATNMAQSLRNMSSQVGQTASEYFEAGKEKAVEWQHTVEEYVHERPLQSLMIAAGVGLLLGILWKRS